MYTERDCLSGILMNVPGSCWAAVVQEGASARGTTEGRQGADAKLNMLCVEWCRAHDSQSRQRAWVGKGPEGRWHWPGTRWSGSCWRSPSARPCCRTVPGSLRASAASSRSGWCRLTAPGRAAAEHS